MDFRRAGILLTVTIGLCNSQAILGQPSFEVASIKPSGPNAMHGSGGGPGTEDPELYRAYSTLLRDLIATAWNIKYFQISSAAPLDRSAFEVMARVPAGATREQFQAMLQNLLSERFGLKVHKESRDIPAYALVTTKTGSKLQHSVKTTAQEGWPILPAGVPAIEALHSFAGGIGLVRVKGQQEPVSLLIQMIEASAARPIVDQTGLTGEYSFALEYSTDMPGQSSGGTQVAPPLLNALPQQLGLQLVAKKLPFDFVVVDSVHPLQAEN
jgi:uncharacterized protein (TIGR03435 family)